MDNTTQYMKVDGEIYLVMSEKLFDLRIKLAYTNGQIDAYRKVEEIRS